MAVQSSPAMVQHCHKLCNAAQRCTAWSMAALYKLKRCTALTQQRTALLQRCTTLNNVWQHCINSVWQRCTTSTTLHNIAMHSLSCIVYNVLKRAANTVTKLHSVQGCNVLQRCNNVVLLCGYLVGHIQKVEYIHCRATRFVYNKYKLW